MAHLVIRDAPEVSKRGTLVPLGDAPVRLGRGSDCDIAIADDALSRRHAELFREGDAFCVRDLGSINGTSVNGTRVVGSRRLEHGDLVVAGFTTLLFEAPEAVARAATVAASIAPPLPSQAPLPSRIANAQEVAAATQPPPEPRVPAPPPATAPPAPVAARRSSGGGSKAFVACCGCFVLTLLLAAAGGALWLVLGDRVGGHRGGGAAVQASGDEPKIVPADFGIQPAPPIEVKRGGEVGAGVITAATGGRIATSDGLTVTVPPGAFASDRSVRVFAASVTPPKLKAGVIGGADVELAALKSWDVDAGPDEGLFDGVVEMKLRVEPGQVPLAAAISIDGRSWTEVPSEIDGETVTIRTRHFSPVTILGTLSAVPYALAITAPVAAIYWITIRADELPGKFHKYAPFVSIDANPQGFRIWWSRQLPGVDPKTGFKDEAAYKSELKTISETYKAFGGGGTTGAASLSDEIAKLRHQHLMPDSVREIENALVHARSYLATRNIDEPMLALDVYVVPTLGGSAGELHNPWVARRYMMVGVDSPKPALWTTALHELFHHYQMGYVWLDRTGHLPLVEASALLMEREARGDYLAAGKPFDISEGVALAQMLVYRNGFDGPKDWQEAFVRRHGYGLTWFLEYLRDERYVGTLKKNDPKTFHAALLKQWRKRWTRAMHKGFVWAADGEEGLGRAWIDFAQNSVLAGPVDRCGNKTPYGAKYNGCPLSASPYTGHMDDYGLPAGKVDLTNSAFKALRDDEIATWSIQFYDIVPPARPKTSIVVKAPRTWFPQKGKARAVFVRAKADDEARSLKDANAAPPSWKDAYAVMPSAGAPVYAYVVDTGQTGSGWVQSNDEGAIFVLEPPANVRSEQSGNRQTLTWTEPPVAATNDVISGYLVYETGAPTPMAFVGAGSTSHAFEIEGSGKSIEVTTAIEVGKAENGQQLYVESERSDPVGSTGSGNYRLCLDMWTEYSGDDHPCSRMLEQFGDIPIIEPCFDVTIGSGGAFSFDHSWTGTFRETENHAIRGKGTFTGGVLKLDGTFTTQYQWTNGLDKWDQTDRGSFAGDGHFIGDVWFGTKLEGTVDVVMNVDRCLNPHEKCTKRRKESSSCGLKIPPEQSSIKSFERK